MVCAALMVRCDRAHMSAAVVKLTLLTAAIFKGDGYVKISIDEREVLHFKNFGRQVSEIIKVGYNPSVYMTRRQKQYLKEHNKRRKYWHQSNNVTYVPLNWSPSLAEESRVYAVKLLDACNTRGILHEPGGERYIIPDIVCHQLKCLLSFSI